jgi:DNA-binding response OmpR family regulator
LEDEALIALDIEDQLQNAGLQVVGVFRSCKTALDWLEDHSPDIAILDIELSDGNFAAIAQLLHERNVPFVVHSASTGESGLYDGFFLAGTWISKPYVPSELQAVVEASLAKASLRL